MKVLVLVAVFSLATAAPSKVSDGPKFCNGLDCPKYTVVSVSKAGYETRAYMPSKWVGTTSTGTDYDKATNAAFQQLFDYIEGENKDKIKIPMASPVASKIVPIGGGQSNFTTLFFVPFAYQSNTSVPTNPALGIVELPAITAYVKSFGGYMRNEQVKENIEKLRTELDNNGQAYVTDFYFAAGYDSPYRFLDRHNEVWLLPK